MTDTGSLSDYNLALLCAETYLPNPYYQIGDALAANVLELSDTFVISFRGTTNLRGWIMDIDALPKSHPLIGYCHRGFLTGASVLYQKISVPPGKKVILTGHSLGGALAVLYGALRIAVGDRVDQLVTFGAPRAGYEKLASVWAPVVNARQYRNGNDPVPGVPLTMLAFPYVHIRGLTAVGVANPGEPWQCHDIITYQTLAAGAPR